MTPLAVLIGLYIDQLPTVEERFLVADQFYQRGDFPNAAESFGTFLSRHTDDVHRDEARVKHDLSLLLNSMDRGVDAAGLLERTVESVVEWGTNSRCAYAQAGLAELLPPLVADLTRRGQQFAEQGEDELADQSLRQAGQALAMIYRYIPSELQRTCGVEQLQLHVTRLQRKIRQPSVLRDALSRIEKDGATGGIEAAYAVRTGLLGHYPDFASDGRLLAAMRAVGRAECARVRSLAGFDNAGTGTLQSLWMKQVVVESAPGSDVDEKDPRVAAILLPDLGCVYALNATSGRTLWRYPVGFGTTCAPIPLDSGSFLLMDTIRGQLIRVNRDTGWPDWRLPTRPLAGQPMVDGGRMVVACKDGTVSVADLNRGAASRALQLPQNLSVGPVADPVAARCYQIAEHSLIYVLASDQTKCLSSYYLGHERGSVTLAPFILDEYLLVLEQIGPEQTEVHVLQRGDQLQPVQTLSMAVNVCGTPAAIEGVLYLPTADHTVQMLRVMSGDNRPIRAEGQIDRASLDVHASGPPQVIVVNG